MIATSGTIEFAVSLSHCHYTFIFPPKILLGSNYSTGLSDQH
jgi:hypothetical protein